MLPSVFQRQFTSIINGEIQIQEKNTVHARRVVRSVSPHFLVFDKTAGHKKADRFERERHERGLAEQERRREILLPSIDGRVDLHRDI